MNEETARESEKYKDRSKPFPIVAIGGSAGGIEAVSELLTHLPADTGMAYVYIQHLSRDHESALTSILSRSTKMQVLEAEHMMAIEANHLFVIPPNKNLTIIDGVFKLADREPRPIQHSPIDCFFMSLAEKQKEGGIGIVLSGTASDGSLGLKAIRMAGGLTYAQDESALFQSMPKAAIAENAVDAVMSPRELAEELVRLSNQKNLLKTVFTPDIKEDQESAEEIDANPPGAESLTPEDMAAIVKMLKNRTGVDFSHYKKSTIIRRIVRRVILHKFENTTEYIDYLKKRPDGF